MATFRKLNRNHKETDQAVKNKILSAVASVFPIEGNMFRLEASNFQIKESDSSLSDVKSALVKGSSIMSSISANLVLIDKQSGKRVDSKTRSIMRVPDFTSKGSFVVEGNSYTIPYQQRLRPGVYTMKKRNGEINSMFNLGKGRNFNIKIDKSGIFRIKIGSSHVSLYSILKDLGESPSAMEAIWGKELFQLNSKTYSTTDSAKFLKAFKYSTDDLPENTDVRKELTDAISQSTVNKNVMIHTVGVDKETIDSSVILAASKRLLGVYKGTEDQDDRENMMFKQVMAPEDMVSEAFVKNSREELNKLKFKLNNPDMSKVDDVFGSSTSALTRPIKNFLTSSKATRLGEEYNPLMMHTTGHFITPMGEGGVGDDRALNLDTKAVHASHFGFIDPLVSPEGSKVGVTLAVTGNSYVDETGAPAIGVLNAKTGKKEIVTVAELWDKNVAYPISKERIKSDGIMVRRGNEDFKAKTKKDVDYIIEKPSDMHAPSSNMVPLINSSDANRTNMAQKHLQQALSIKTREKPHVSVGHDGKDFAAVVSSESGHLPHASMAGEVTKIDDKFIYIKGEKGQEKVDYVQNMPLARKTFIDHKLLVKVGDKVKKGQALADSNFTKDGHMALGKNVRTAWLSMPGNRNDGIIISESASEQFTSEHMYKENVHINASESLDMKKFNNLFPSVVSKWGGSNYDTHGVIKKGTKLTKGQPLVFKLAKTDARQIKTKLEKVMHKPFKAVVSTWHHQDPGEVIDIERGASEIRITVKVESKAKVGDKLSARQGNKGVITKIIPDDEMPKNTKGEAVDLLMTAAGVISRTNGGSLIEAGLGKVVEKTKKSYALDHYEKTDNLKYMEDEAKKNGVELYETLINPETGKPFPQKVFVGNPFIMKLFKDSESGMSAVGVNGTDVNGQPLKGGEESAASYSNMEVNALLAHGAKDLLREAKSIKGQRNDDFFDAFRRGAPLPPPSENFASAKFKAYLTQLGAHVETDKRTTEFSLIPMKDSDIIKKSAGAIKNSDTIYAKDGKVVKGGLFDETVFGGPNGNRYGHIKLGVKILNPMYKDHVSRLLGMTSEKLDDKMKKEGSSWISEGIKKIDPAKEIERLKAETDGSSNVQLANKNIKLIKFLDKVKSMKGKVNDYAFISNVPVIPPVYRPVTKDGNGDISINDMNMHYQDINLIANAITHSRGNSKGTKQDLEYELFKSVGAMYGVEKSPNKKMVDKGVKGVLDILGGDTPKQSFSQKNLLRMKQFMSGRAVIKPARTDLSIDEIELPESMGLKIYEPHISRRLARAGFSPVQSKEMIEGKDKRAISAMEEIAKDVPVVYNRAPSLWKHNMLGGYAKFVKGNTIGLNPLTERSLGSDYDGDAVSVHVPVTRKAIDDVKNKILPSKNIFTDQSSYSDPDVVIMPDQDATLGIFKSSRASSKRTVKVKSVTELKAKLKSGEINYNDKVSIA